MNYSQIKCLDVKTSDLMLNDLIWGVLELGCECEQIELGIETNDFEEKAIQELKDFIDSEKIDIAMTMDFCPSIARACAEKGVPYAAWIYDSPIQAIFHEEAKQDTNYFFVFDRYQLEEFKKLGFTHVYYLPLAANVTRTGQLSITKEDEREFYCDISFVGMQYIDGRYAMYRDRLEPEFRNQLEGFALNMLGHWDKEDRVHEKMPQELIDAMVGLSEDEPVKLTGMPNRIYFESVVVPRAVAYTERRLMIEKVADLHPRWYGSKAEEKDMIPGVEYLPRLTYEDRLPKAYYLSRINLSTCLHSISSGLPLRVFDIMGAGGFILSNYQPEMDDLFKVGKEIVVYHDFDEMKDLAKYYLKHETERLQVLAAGYKRVCRDYTFPVGVKRIIDTVFAG
ncbi:CgeB family protein [Butyrivibrio proteoclasticus]|uniref:CgeB family protein n=1 Tax=Butyrivibrio proteoclasticus TaxID=43305 RepID=UPI00047E4EDB|nr:DUF3880 domain-containing protein [Butyrivibrio proteoclasticus]